MPPDGRGACDERPRALKTGKTSAEGNRLRVNDRAWAPPDAVQIKVTVPASLLGPAWAELGLRDDHGERRRIYFCEDLTSLYSRLPLLAGGVVLRLRHRAGGGGDSTVRLRPARRSRLAASWTGGQFPRVEADWAGDRRVLDASLTAAVDVAALAGLTPGRPPPQGMFGDAQRRFLRQCADVAVDVDNLTVLGPISTHRWGHLLLGGFPVAAERWRLGSPAGDLLEFSTRVEPDGAEIARLGFETALREFGVDPDACIRSTKTAHFLAILAAEG